jgi:hypothetical protein
MVITWPFDHFVANNEFSCKGSRNKPYNLKPLRLNRGADEHQSLSWLAGWDWFKQQLPSSPKGEQQGCLMDAYSNHPF